jgi:hypothetical protein
MTNTSVFRRSKTLWGERAREAAKSGYVGHETAMAVLMQRLQEVEEPSE